MPLCVRVCVYGVCVMRIACPTERFHFVALPIELDAQREAAQHRLVNNHPHPLPLAGPSSQMEPTDVEHTLG